MNRYSDIYYLLSTTSGRYSYVVMYSASLVSTCRSSRPAYCHCHCHCPYSDPSHSPLLAPQFTCSGTWPINKYLETEINIPFCVLLDVVIGL